jgi:hypothetical protein
MHRSNKYRYAYTYKEGMGMCVFSGMHVPVHAEGNGVCVARRVFPNSFFNADLLIPAHRQTTPLTIRTSHASSEPSDTTSSRTVMPLSTQRQHRWLELVPPQTAVTFVDMYNPAEGLLTFSGASLLPSKPPTPPTPHTPSSALDTPDMPTTTAFGPMPRMPTPSTLADMQSLLDTYFRSASTATGNNNAIPARTSSTFDSHRCGCILPNESGSTKMRAGVGVRADREKPLPVRPPPLPDRDGVFVWLWLGHMASDDPREHCDASGNDCGGDGCPYWPSVVDSGYVSEGCDGDSFYFTSPELEDQKVLSHQRS